MRKQVFDRVKWDAIVAARRAEANIMRGDARGEGCLMESLTFARRRPKRGQRLWRLEGLKVPYRKRKKPLRGLGVHVGATSPICPNAIWAMWTSSSTRPETAGS